MGGIIRANSRNAKRYIKGQRAKKIYGSKNPTDDEIRAKESKDRKQRIADYKARKKNPKAIIKKPRKVNKDPDKEQTKKVPEIKHESYADSIAAARRSNRKVTGRSSGARNTGAGVSDPYGALARQPPMKKKVKSFNKLEALIKSMESIIKNEESTQARVTDVDLGTKIRQRKREGQMRDEPKEVKTGDKYNFESRVGDAAIKSGCRLWKTELNNSFNNTLDVFQELYKDAYSDNKFNEQHGKGKKQKVTESGRSGKGSLGGNTGETDEESSHKMSY